jgi:hypothetical protein
VTIIPFPVEGAGRSASSGPAFCAEAAVTGAFGSPSGGTGTFTGAYRLERFVNQYDHLAAAGVFTGELIDADGTAIGVGSRRHTAAVSLGTDSTALVADMGPVDVNLLGFLVNVREFRMQVRRSLPTGMPAPVIPPSAAELMKRLVAVHDTPHRPAAAGTQR